MNTQQIFKILSAIKGLESKNAQNLNSPEINKAFNEFWEKFLKSNAPVLSSNLVSLIKIFNRGSLLHLALALNHIDDNFPGLSFMTVMEAKHDESAEGQYFIQRLKLLESKGLISDIFSPMRTKLITGILNEENFISSTIENIKDNFNITTTDVKTIEKILSSAPYKNILLELPILSEQDFLSLLESALVEKSTN